MHRVLSPHHLVAAQDSEKLLTTIDESFSASPHRVDAGSPSAGGIAAQMMRQCAQPQKARVGNAKFLRDNGAIWRTVRGRLAITRTVSTISYGMKKPSRLPTPKCNRFSIPSSKNRSCQRCTVLSSRTITLITPWQFKPLPYKTL